MKTKASVFVLFALFISSRVRLEPESSSSNSSWATWLILETRPDIQHTVSDVELLVAVKIES
jgi:hypothetical protein